MFFNITLILTLLFIQQTTVKIHLDKEIRISLDFLILEIVLYPTRNNKKKKKVPLVAIITSAKRSVDHLLPRASVTVISNGENRAEPQRFPLFTVPSLISKYTIYAYLKNKCKSFVYKDGDTSDADFIFSFRLFYMIISLIIFAYYMLKYKIKRIKNV